MQPISKGKIKFIHVAKTQLKLTDAEYREILRHHGGVDTSKNLDAAAADRVIKHLQSIGFWAKRKGEQTRPRNAEDMVTPPQLEVIEHLWVDFAEYEERAMIPRFRRGFMVKRLHLSPLGPQTRKEANDLIEALKNRVRAAMKRHAEGRGAEVLDVPF